MLESLNLVANIIEIVPHLYSYIQKSQKRDEQVAASASSVS
jgi:hypothetical protein